MVKLWFRMVPNNQSRAENMKEKNRKTVNQLTLQIMKINKCKS